MTRNGLRIQAHTPRAEGINDPATRLGFERVFLSVRLGFLLVPWLLVAVYGWSAGRVAVQVDVAVGVNCAFVWVLLSRYPTQALRWQLALRLIDVAVVSLALHFIDALAGNALYESLYVLLVVATAATQGHRGTHWIAASATLAVFLGHVQPMLDGGLRFHPWHIGDSLFYALLFLTTGSIMNAVRQRAQEVVSQHALHDHLTALPNRTLLEDRLQHGLLAAHRTNMPLTLLLLDLNRFQTVNETHGDRGGDLVLQQVARRLQEHLRGADTVARFDGDAFAMVLPRTDEIGAVRAAEKLGAWLRRPIAVGGCQVELDASIGISIYPWHGTQATLLLDRATQALQVAKQTACRYTVYDAGTAPLRAGAR